ncbi:hypothetical protein [Trinickia sp.]
MAEIDGNGVVVARLFCDHWDVSGRTFEDHDGYRIVLQNSAWSA